MGWTWNTTVLTAGTGGILHGADGAVAWGRREKRHQGREEKLEGDVTKADGETTYKKWRETPMTE